MFNFQAFIRRKWSEYSQATGQKGTVVDELAVKPTGLVMSDFYNTLVNQRRVNNIENWESMTDEELDFFGNKFFFPRIDGDYAFGNARIWFNEKKNITFTTDSRFASEDGQLYRVQQPGTIGKGTFKNSTDRFALYYVDVPIIAVSKGNQFNVDAGKIVQINNIDFTYVTTSNLEDFRTGSKYETNEEYYNRMLYSINDRSMMNKRSIITMLPTFFPVVKGIYIAGSGDRYMKRDLVSGIDVSLNNQKIDFLGKVSGENLIKHVAFYGIFPPVTGDIAKDNWGPFSIITDYKYPLTIEPSDTSAAISSSGQTGDPALHGYSLNQEFTDEQYKGLYFDDYKRYSEIITKDLFNIDQENVGLTDVVTPSSEWIHGAQGRKKGDLGPLYDEFQDVDVIKFNGSDITLSTGAKNNINVGKDIGKRVGVKLTGTITFPEVVDSETSPANTNIQLMIGGINSTISDGYTGIGFGVRLLDAYDFSQADVDENYSNAVVYFAHGEQYGTAQVFATDFDLSSHISVTDLGALAETAWSIESGVEYDFEFILHDDLRISLYLNKSSNPVAIDENNTLKWELPKTVLSVYSQELFNNNTDHYGTTMKIALDAISEDSPGYSWVVSDLKAFDIQQSRATAILAINVKDIDDPSTLSLRAFGRGSVDGVPTNGYVAYIWDKEMSSVASGSSELTRGAWSQLPGISNITGTKDVLTNIPSQVIENFERYKVNSRIGENIFIMLTASGTSKANSLYSGEFEDDIQSRLRIDYVKMEGESAFYYHANNKTDIYLVTVKNSEELETTTTVISKDDGNTYFEMSLDTNCKMPLNEILSVTIGTSVSETESLSDNEYSIVRGDVNLKGSSKEIIHIVLNDTDADTITVEYNSYPEINNVQKFFDSSQYEKVYGDILVKHKMPVYLSFNVSFTGNISEDQLIDEIRKYVDENIDGTFSTREMVSYLYNEGLVNNIQEPVEISYSLTDNEGNIQTGIFTDTLKIRDVDYFRIDDLSVSRL